ncbi:MAG: DapH/DapD/GlmU-related protein [Chloroflexota bacterium]|nr:DapH/DapD/GlmU-related protein [Chloroflexota bacterium]
MLHRVAMFPDPVPDSLKALKNKKLSERPYIHPTSIVRDSYLGSWTDIGPNTYIGESKFDDYSYAAGDVMVIYSDVGKFCSIASHTRINPGNHPMDRVTQHHCTYRRVQYGFDDTDDEAFFYWRRAAKCVVGHDVWIGTGAIILPGVHVGSGAVVGAGAVVTKDVAAYEVVVGVPAKPIRKRFPDETIEKLEQTAWWDWDRQTLEERFHELGDVNTFVEKYAC